MPRDGSGIYSIPLGTDGVPDQTIESTKYNNAVHDLEQDNNTPRPIVAGGTGATNAISARRNIGAEVSSLQQIVTNYDAQIWESGSFASLIGAIAAPTNAEHFSGVSTILSGEANPLFVTLRAIGNATGKTYTRRKENGVWANGGVWTEQNAAALAFTPTGNIIATTVQGAIAELDTEKVAKAGDTMSGDLIIAKANPGLVLRKQGSGQNSAIYGHTGSTLRWTLELGNTTAESGTAIGSDFTLTRYDNAGSSLGQPIVIARDSGVVTLGDTRINNTLIIPQISPAANLAAVTVGYSNLGARIGVSLTTDNDVNSYPVAFFSAAKNLVGSINTTAAATAYNTSSSAELKEDLKSFDAGNIVDATNVYDFAWKSTKERAFGVLAQQAVEVYPAAVTHDAERDWWGVDYSKYVPVLIQEIKALRARVAQLEAGIASKPA